MLMGHTPGVEGLVLGPGSVVIEIDYPERGSTMHETPVFRVGEEAAVVIATSDLRETLENSR